MIPIWLRRKRQEILSLDETIPYDEAEQELEEPELTTLFRTGDAAGDTASTGDSVTQDGEGVNTQTQQDDSVQSSDGTGLPVLPTSSHTRAGRKVRPNPRFHDYLT